MIYREDHSFQKGSLEIQGGRIKELQWGESQDKENDDCLDARGNYVIPGLVDIHFHGCKGVDFCDGEADTIGKMAAYEASVGVTSICPASMTMSVKELHHIMQNAGQYQGENGAHFVGIHMEGPFLSKKNKGAQAEENIVPCDAALFRCLQKESGDRIKIVDVAPEEAGAMEFIQEMREEVVVSLAHTLADYQTSMQAMEQGASHVTHLHNAMPVYHHRDPGVIGAAFEQGVNVELICDGVHIHPNMIRHDFKLFGADKICMISDSMRAAGLKDGQYTLGGQDVTVKGNLAVLADGTIAGSVTNLMDCLRYAVKEAGIPLEDAVRCASENPAKVIGAFADCGSISLGKRADLIMLDKDLQLKQVFIEGKDIL